MTSVAGDQRRARPAASQIPVRRASLTPGTRFDITSPTAGSGGYDRAVARHGMTFEDSPAGPRGSPSPVRRHSHQGAPRPSEPPSRAPPGRSGGDTGSALPRIASPAEPSSTGERRISTFSTERAASSIPRPGHRAPSPVPIAGSSYRQLGASNSATILPSSIRPSERAERAPYSGLAGGSRASETTSGRVPTGGSSNVYEASYTNARTGGALSNNGALGTSGVGAGTTTTTTTSAYRANGSGTSSGRASIYDYPSRTSETSTRATEPRAPISSTISDYTRPAAATSVYDPPRTTADSSASRYARPDSRTGDRVGDTRAESRAPPVLHRMSSGSAGTTGFVERTYGAGAGAAATPSLASTTTSATTYSDMGSVVGRGGSGSSASSQRSPTESNVFDARSAPVQPTFVRTPSSDLLSRGTTTTSSTSAEDTGRVGRSAARDLDYGASSATKDYDYSTSSASRRITNSQISSLTRMPSDTFDAMKGSGLVGLQNLGNTCFMNSALQCLSNTPQLREYFLKGPYRDEINTGAHTTRGRLALAFGELIQELWTSSRAVTPSSFKSEIGRFAPRFVGYSQQDSQEFLRFLLDGLQEDLNRVRGKLPYRELTDDPKLDDRQKAEEAWKYQLSRNNSAITDIFGGQLASTVVCGTCGHTSKAFDPFLDLSIPIPRKAQVKERFFSATSASTADYNLSDCLDEFTEVEDLDGDERYYCSKCKTHRKSTKQLYIYRLPNVLVLHLKRFKYTHMYRDKLTTNIIFPLTGLDLGRYCPNEARNAVYDLIAVSNHMGGLGGGHYTAYGLNTTENKWYSFNDSQVHAVRESAIQGSSAYMLFYQRRAR